MGGTGKSRRGGKRAQKKWRGGEAWLERKGEGPFSQIKGGTGAPLTVILRPLLVEDDVCRQFEVPPLAAVVAPLAVLGLRASCLPVLFSDQNPWIGAALSVQISQAK